jgi:similar to stage IV sporulation protein
MNNGFLSYFEDIIMLRVTGKNINRFLAILYKNKIELIEVTVINRNEVNIKIYKKDLERIKKIKTANEIDVVGYFGKLKAKELIKTNKIILVSLLIGYFFLLFLSNVIFDIQVIHDNQNIRNLVMSELKENDIRVLRFKKSYDKLEEIEELILEKNKDKIEWLEIIEIGTRYIVRVEERKIIEQKEEYIYQDIIASKNAIIIKIEAENGMVINKINDYVKKGDTIISGKIMHGQKIMDIVKASGKIFGEVWYNIKVEFPLIRKEEKDTGRIKDILNIKILNYKLPIFDFKPFRYKRVAEKTIIFHRFLPVTINKEKQHEVKILEFIYNESESLIGAKELADRKMNERLSDEEEIISSRILKYYIDNNVLYIDIFYRVSEDITATKPISLINDE